MRFYFSGICGTAMGNGALLLKAQGHEVVGSDSGAYPPMSDVLADAGIQVFDGFEAQRLEDFAPDYVVIGNALSRGNPEVEFILDQSKIPFVSLPHLFHTTILPNRKPIVVTGTHGKTTTSTIAGFLLNENGMKPGWLIGGVPLDLPDGASLGEGLEFVIEGDEYDSAFFDKRSKFIHYRPHVALINNLEFDHADIFRDLEDVQRSFRHFLRIIPASGHAVLNGDDTCVMELLPAPWTNIHRVGVGTENDLIIRNFQDGPNQSAFELLWKGKLWAKVAWPLHGLFNARNAAMAALGAALSVSPDDPTRFDLSVLHRFQGVKRRQDVLLDTEGVTVLEDFAHHPTAIKAAIEALRAAYEGRRLVVCFEPRSNTASTSLFEEAFTNALSAADDVYIGAVHRKMHLPAGQRLDIHKIAA
ncbi:MAG: Mur ligase family protein [Verrucomicrobiota bacterium]